MSKYLTKELIPFTESKSVKHMLEAFVKCWTDFIMFAELMDRMFGQLGRRLLENE